MITSEMVVDRLDFLTAVCGSPAGYSDAEKQAWTKEFCLQLAVEAFEAMDNVNWKHHRVGKRPVDREALLEELVDCSKFWLNLLLTWSVTPEEFAAAWWKKSAKIRVRRDNETASDSVARMDRSQLEDAVRKLTVDLQYGSAQEENDRCVGWLRSNGHDTIAEVIEEGFNRRVVEG